MCARINARIGLKRAFTLVELTITIAVTSIIVLGVTGILIATATLGNDMTNAASWLNNVQTLETAIDEEINMNRDSISFISNTAYVDDDYKKNLEEDDVRNAQILFTVKNEDEETNYIFAGQQFGTYKVINGLTNYEFNAKVVCTNKVNLEITSSNNEYIFSLIYGENQNQLIRLVKYIDVMEQYE